MQSIKSAADATIRYPAARRRFMSDLGRRPRRCLGALQAPPSQRRLPTCCGRSPRRNFRPSSPVPGLPGTVQAIAAVPQQIRRGPQIGMTTFRFCDQSMRCDCISAARRIIATLPALRLSPARCQQVGNSTRPPDPARPADSRIRWWSADRSPFLISREHAPLSRPCLQSGVVEPPPSAHQVQLLDEVTQSCA